MCVKTFTSVCEHLDLVSSLTYTRENSSARLTAALTHTHTHTHTHTIKQMLNNILTVKTPSVTNTHTAQSSVFSRPWFHFKAPVNGFRESSVSQKPVLSAGVSSHTSAPAWLSDRSAAVRQIKRISHTSVCVCHGMHDRVDEVFVCVCVCVCVSFQGDLLS